MLTCVKCGATKGDKDFYLRAVPEDPTYHFCKACTKAAYKKNYIVAKQLIADNSEVTALCHDCLEEKTAVDFSPCQLGNALTGFWSFCRPCANERSRLAWQKKKEARTTLADLLGEKVKASKTSKYKKSKRVKREKEAAEAEFIKAQRVEELAAKKQKVLNNFAKQLLGD